MMNRNDPFPVCSPGFLKRFRFHLQKTDSNLIRNVLVDFLSQIYQLQRKKMLILEKLGPLLKRYFGFYSEGLIKNTCDSISNV